VEGEVPAVDAVRKIEILQALKADVQQLSVGDDKHEALLRLKGGHLLSRIFGEGSRFEAQWDKASFLPGAFLPQGKDEKSEMAASFWAHMWERSRDSWVSILDAAVAAIEVGDELGQTADPRVDMGVRLFISHSTADAEFAKVVTDSLRILTGLPEKAIRCTSVAPYRLTPGTAVNEQLREDLRSAEVVLGLLSTASVASSYVLYELGGAWALGKVTVPLLFGEASFDLLPGPAKDTHAVRADSTTGALDMITTVCKALGVEPSIRAAGAAADDICNAAKALKEE